MTTKWLPATFDHPRLVEWAQHSVHLRPIRAADVDIDMIAVMGNRDKLWRMYGAAWGWPPASMSREEDIADLQHHADEMERHESFNYAILPPDESELLGCLYIDPVSSDTGPEAEVSWWLTDNAAPSLHSAIRGLTVAWLHEAWPFTRIHMPFNAS